MLLAQSMYYSHVWVERIVLLFSDSRSKKNYDLATFSGRNDGIPFVAEYQAAFQEICWGVYSEIYNSKPMSGNRLLFKYQFIANGDLYFDSGKTDLRVV